MIYRAIWALMILWLVYTAAHALKTGTILA
jgi:hypothetical protein